MLDNGIININKPQGLTSHDVVGRLRRRLHIKRVGHTGTLDPMATGVLPICFGKATRIIEYYDGDYKTYVAEMKLGTVTDTLDITGAVIEENDWSSVTEDQVRDALCKITGIVTQVPPKYSALKVNGKRLYEYAREGLDVEIKGREIYVDSIKVLEVNLESGIVRFEVTCSKGTYIRTICDDAGRTLGCGACMTSLVRTRSGVFDVNAAYNLEDVINMSDEQIEKIVLKMDGTLANLGVAILPEHRVKPYLNGMSTSFSQIRVITEPAQNLKCDRADWFSRLYRMYDNQNNFLGVSYLDDNREMIPSKILRG